MTDWDHRELCPDGSCTGVIGPEGTCKVCGRAAPNWGDERKRGLLTDEDESVEAEESDDEDEGESVEAEESDDEDEDGDEDGDEGADEDEDADTDDDDGEAESDEEGAATTAGAGEWGERKLCPDGGCIGVIGPDGTCKVCGRSAA